MLRYGDDDIIIRKVLTHPIPFAPGSSRDNLKVVFIVSTRPGLESHVCLYGHFRWVSLFSPLSTPSHDQKLKLYILSAK